MLFTLHQIERNASDRWDNSQSLSLDFVDVEWKDLYTAAVLIKSWRFSFVSWLSVPLPGLPNTSHDSSELKMYIRWPWVLDYLGKSGSQVKDLSTKTTDCQGTNYTTIFTASGVVVVHHYHVQ